MRRWFTVFTVLSLVQTLCFAGPLPAPDLKPGQFVYTIPAGFDPPLIGRAGMADIQREASRLHYPYYVVLVDHLPGGTDDDAAAAVDGLAEDWSSNPRYNVRRSSIFLLTYQPRKFRFLAGAEWKSRLGFEKDAHAPYTEHFLRQMKGTPKDPRTGIIEMMKAVDAYLFDQTDPRRIAARQEIARQEKVRRELEAARGQLQEESNRLADVLQMPERYLPANHSAETGLLARARNAIKGSQPASMLALASAMRSRSEALEAHVQWQQEDEAARIRAEEARRRAETRRKTTYGLIAAVALSLLAWRWGSYRSLRRAFQRQTAMWDERVMNAKNRYVQFYGDHDTIRKLVDPAGETAALYASVTAEVDAIFQGVSAMESHLQECRAKAGRGSYLRMGPLARALKDLDGSFSFDTGKLNPADLFGAETKTITVEPRAFFDELEERFRKTLEDWNRLKEASEMRYTPAQDLFTQKTLDTQISRAEAAGIPIRWVADHPLYGDDTADRNLYDTVNENRWNDPVAFANRLGSLRATESEIVDRIDRIIASQALLKADRLDAVPEFGTTVLRPEDDPRMSFDAARREEDRFAGILAASERVEDVEEQARLVNGLYRTCAEQAATARSAIDGAQAEVEAAGRAARDAEAASDSAVSRLGVARQVHARIDGAESLFNAGRSHMDSGRRDLDEATRLLAECRHVEARRKAAEASAAFAAASDEFAQCLTQCDELDRQKMAFEQKAREMEASWQAAASRMRRYGGSTSRLNPVNLPMGRGGAADYVYLLGLLSTQQAAWDREVRQAQRAYEEEQRRREQEAAEARRRAEEAAERSRRSSGSSFGGSHGSSSSGGGWSGPSSSSGSSSSGGSW